VELVECVDAGDRSDLEAEESEHHGGQKEQGAAKWLAPEKADEAADRRGENEKQAKSEEPGGENTDNEQPDASWQ
jgi:hypothetical protein